jgi:NOL1/NOP2/fmu family ribosome biogenesis protein
MPGESTPTGFNLWDSSWPRYADGDQRRAIEDYLWERFMVPAEALEGFLVFQRGATFYFLARESGEASDVTRTLKVVSVGLPAIRVVGRQLKPTSSLLRILSPWIKKNRVKLTQSQALELLSKGSISFPAGEHEKGYVLVETEHLVLGCGLLQKNVLRSQIPTSGASLSESAQVPALGKTIS